MRPKQRVCNRLLIRLLAGLVLLMSSQAGAQTSDSLPAMHKGFLLSCWRDSRDLVLFPAHLRKNDLWFVAGGATLTGLSFLADEEVFRQWSFQGLGSDGEKLIKYTLTPWGNGLYPASAALIVYGVGLANKNEDLKWLSLFQFKTIGIAALASRVPKWLLQRHRPGDDAPPDNWQWVGPFGGISGYDAFPSGHSFISFACASATAAATPGRPWLHAGLYGVATLTAASRVYTGKHWLSDAIGGAVMGYALGKLMYRLQEKNWKRRSVSRPKPY